MAALVFSLRFDSPRHEVKVFHGSSSSRVGGDDKRVAGRGETCIRRDYSELFDVECGGVVDALWRMQREGDGRSGRVHNENRNGGPRLNLQRDCTLCCSGRKRRELKPALCFLEKMRK